MNYTYKYPRPAVTADCVVMTKESEPHVLPPLAFDHEDIMRDSFELYRGLINRLKK